MSHNVWSKFINLVGSDVEFVATVGEVKTDGTSIVTSVNGITSIVGGNNFAVGKKVLIKNGIIVREMPNVTLTRYEV